MKKKVITLLLSLVLASGGAGHVQVLAAETTGQEAEPVQEEAYEREEEPVMSGKKNRYRKKLMSRKKNRFWKKSRLKKQMLKMPLKM